MSNSTSTEKKILILSCNGHSAMGLITRLAAQELVLEGTAEWCPDRSINEGVIVGDTTRQQIILVSGCRERCRFNDMRQKKFSTAHQFILSEVGIEPEELDEITRDDIDLAKDAVIAECTPVGNAAPVFFPGCCCR